MTEKISIKERILYIEKTISNEIASDEDTNKEKEIPDPEKCLLWKLSLQRKDAFEAMNSDVDEIVTQCFKAKRHLEAVEDSNGNLRKEIRSLREKYEALLEKNKFDTGIILRLKDSESELKTAKYREENTKDELMLVNMKNTEKLLERELFQNNFKKLLLKSQITTKNMNKVNLKHKQLYEKIIAEHSKGKDDEKQLAGEIKELRSNQSMCGSILERWMKSNTDRDEAIRNLQDSVREGSMIGLLEIQSEETNFQDATSEEVHNSDSQGVQQSENESALDEKTDTEKPMPDENTDKQAILQEWLSKKVLYEVAEKQNKYWTELYKKLNERLKQFSIEIINVREWRFDKEAQKRDLSQRVEQLEQIVRQKRRNRSVPDRTHAREMDIWIKVQRETNATLRSVASKCLSLKLNDFAAYFEFSDAVRCMYLEALKKDIDSKPKNNIISSEKKDIEADNT